jgi:heme-degrading monooxygenase HmoA
MSEIERRTCLGIVLAGAVVAVKATAASAQHPIQLHCDLSVDPKREQEMLDAFEKVFRPVARKQPGFIDLRMLKIREPIRGTAPAKYQFVLTMESEELRQKWIKTAEHAKAWPLIENTLTDKNFSILVYDVY